MSNAALDRAFLSKEIPYIRPFYSIDYKSSVDILDWFQETENALQIFHGNLFREQKNNLRRFLGGGIAPNFMSPYVATYWAQMSLNADRSNVNINEFYRIVIDQVTTIVSNELVPQVLPNNDDYGDKISSQVVKQWLDSMNYDLNTDMLRVRWEMQKKIFGEAFVIPMWNPDKGEVSKVSKEFADDDLEYVDEEGNSVIDVDGNPVKIKSANNIRIGDIEFANPMPFDVRIDPKSKFEDSDWFYWCEWVEIEYLRKKYKKKSFNKDYQSTAHDPSTGELKGSPNHKKVYYFYHRSHPFLSDGRYIVCTDDNVLVNESLEDLPTLIDAQELPLVRFVDLDVGFGSRGMPILFRNTANVIDGYNKLTNQVMNNLEMESPKILSHVNANFDARRMPVGITLMEYTGNIAPTFFTPSTNTSSIFKFREDLKKNILELSLQTPSTRGDTANAQLDSFIALQHFEDMRQQLASPDIKGHIKCLEKLYRLMIVIAKDKYDPEDKRLIKILGKHNSYRLKYFDPENLQKSYDIRITSTGNLANSKAARTQLILTLKREFPQLIQDEIFIDMLGMSASEKYMNAITASVSSAEAENQDMLLGMPVLPPERFEDLIVHWQQHRIPMNTLDFKMSTPEIQELFVRHVAATEKLMIEMAKESPTFAERLVGLPQFPMFYIERPTNEPLPQMPEEMQEPEVPQSLGGVPPEVNSAPQEASELPPFLSPEEQTDDSQEIDENQLTPA